MPRKTKLTPELIDICVENIKLGMPYTACSKAIGISYQTWCNWVNLGKEGKYPYSLWYIKIQEAEAALMKECLDSVKLSMKLGDVKSAMFLLEKRFSDDGYGKTSQVKVNAQNQNLNLNVNSSATTEDIDKIRAEILARLVPKSRLIEIQES